VILRREPHVKAAIEEESLKRQRRHSSSSFWQSDIACFNDKRALNPPRFARFLVVSWKLKENGCEGGFCLFFLIKF